MFPFYPEWQIKQLGTKYRQEPLHYAEFGLYLLEILNCNFSFALVKQFEVLDTKTDLLHSKQCIYLECELDNHEIAQCDLRDSVGKQGDPEGKLGDQDDKLGDPKGKLIDPKGDLEDPTCDPVSG